MWHTLHWTPYMTCPSWCFGEQLVILDPTFKKKKKKKTQSKINIPHILLGPLLLSSSPVTTENNFTAAAQLKHFDDFQRDCESDQEEEILKRRPRTRKRSSTSWEQQPATSVSVADVPVAKQWLCTFFDTHFAAVTCLKDFSYSICFEWRLWRQHSDWPRWLCPLRRPTKKQQIIW